MPIHSEVVKESEFVGFTDRDRLVRLTAVMETLTDEVQTLSTELRSHKDQNFRAVETKLAVTEDRVGTLSKIVYGCAAAVGIQFLAGVGGVLVWAITRGHT